MTSLALVTIASISIPIAAALLSHLLARIRRIGNHLAKGSTILAAGLTLLLVTLLMADVFNHGTLKATIITLTVPTGNIELGFHVDSLALLPAFVSSFFTILALIYNIQYLSLRNVAYSKKIDGSFNRTYSVILLFNGTMLGTLFSDNLLGIFIFWELISICSYALISFWNKEGVCLRAALKCFIMTHLGTILFLVATIVIFSTTGDLNMSKAGEAIPTGAPVVPFILGLLMVAVLPKTVLFPLHTWLPDGTVAPTSATVLFHVCGFQSGIYIIIRFFADVFREHVISAPRMVLPSIFGNMSTWSFLLVLIGAITILIGALNGIIENDYKRMVAFSTISQLGFIVMAIGTVMPFGIMAGLFHMISHALYCGLLFLSAGGMIFRTGRHDINEIGAVYRRMPVTTACSIIGILSLSTMPLLSDFASKYLIFNAMMDVEAPVFIFVSFIGCILNMAIALRLLHAVFLKQPAKVANVIPAKDLPRTMLAPLVITAALLVLFGILPAIPLILLVIPAVHQIIPAGFPTSDILVSWSLEMPGGFWNPAFIAVSLLVLIVVFIVILYASRKTDLDIVKTARDEEKSKPFLCGEDISLLDVPNGHHLYHALASVLRIDLLCRKTNADRVYNAFTTKFSKFCDKLLHLDIQQKPIAVSLSFIGGVLLIILVAILL
jgi:multicomponent Na+:H+ antiporter subunit A